MAVPAYATDLTDIVTSFTTGWSLTSEGGGGQNALTAPETDDFIEGTQSVSRNPFSTSVRGVIYDKAATVAVASGDAVYYWWKADVAAALDTKANGGVHLTMGTSIAIYKKFYVAGNDNYALGGWKCVPIDPDNTGSLDRGTPGLPDYDFFGVAFDLPGSGPSKGFPFKCDMIRHGRSVDVTAGEIANPATWDALTTYADNTTRRWGIVQGTDTGAEQQGIVNWGTAAALVYSRDSARAIVFTDTEFTTTSFTQLLFANASTDIEWDAMTFTALGTNNRGIVTISNNAAVSITNSIFGGIDTTADGGTNTVFDGTKWSGCNAVTSIGGSYLGSSILVPTVAADTAGFVYNVATDPDGEMDDMTFSKGTNAHHAIEFDATNTPTTITLRGIDFTGFNATNGNNDSALYFPSTSKSYTVNLVECTGDISYKVGVGGTVTLVVDPRSFKFTLSPTNTAYEWRIYSVTAVGSLDGSVELAGEESATVDNQTYSYTYGVDTPIAVQIIDNPSDYVESVTYYTLVDGNQDITINLEIDENNESKAFDWLYEGFEVGNANSTTLVLPVRGLLNTGAAPATSDFTVSGNTVSAVSLTTAYQVRLTLGTAVVNTDTVTVSYTSGINPIKDVNNVEASDFTTQAVINNVTYIELMTDSNAVSLTSEANSTTGFIAGNQVSFSSVITDAHIGTYCLKVETTTTNATSGRVDYAFNIVSGKTYTFKVSAKGVTGSLTKAIEVVDGFTTNQQQDITTSWVDYEFSLVADETRSTRIRLFSNYVAGSIGDYNLFDGISIQTTSD